MGDKRQPRQRGAQAPHREPRVTVDATLLGMLRAGIIARKVLGCPVGGCPVGPNAARHGALGCGLFVWYYEPKLELPPTWDTVAGSWMDRWKGPFHDALRWAGAGREMARRAKGERRRGRAASPEAPQPPLGL